MSNSQLSFAGWQALMQDLWVQQSAVEVRGQLHQGSCAVATMQERSTPVATDRGAHLALGHARRRGPSCRGERGGCSFRLLPFDEGTLINLAHSPVNLRHSSACPALLLHKVVTQLGLDLVLHLRQVTKPTFS